MYEELKKLAEDYNPGTFDSIDPEEILALLAERNQLKAENEALRKDAERYRWLRENHIFAHVQVEQSDGTQPYVYSGELDRSVDEIMAALRKDSDQ